MSALDPQVAQQVKGLAIGRIAIGVAAVLAPRSALKRWLGPGADRADTRVLARMTGVRDVAIGVGTLLAVNHDAPVRGWLEAGALSDAGDLAASLLGLRSGLPKLPLLTSAGAAALGVAFGRRLVSQVAST